MKDDNYLRAHNARHLWHPMGHPGGLQETPPRIITGAQGVKIKDIDGHEAVDGVGGLWCVNLGYSNDKIKEAVARQMTDLPYYSAFGGTTNPAAIEASELVADFFRPDGMERVFFTSGGSDAVDTALRLARQYHKLRGDHGRTKFLSVKKGYHGTHFGGASVNGNNRFRIAYEPLLPGCFHIPAPYTYRNPFNETDPERLADLVAQAFADEIAFQDPSTIAAFIMEPIMGAGGVIVPHESLFPKLREICSRHGILMIADEVICGFGRTGDWSGSRHWGVQPDMMTTAKGITSGYFPVGAALVSGAVAEVFENSDPSNGIWHGYTYSAHPVGAAAVVACMEETLRLDLRANASARGTQLFDGLRALMDKHSLIGDVRGGHGLMTALELVSDKEAKTPLDAEHMGKIHTAIYEAGAMVRIGGNNLMMSPPLTISESEVQTIINGIDHALSTV